MPIGAFRLNAISRALASGPTLGNYGLFKVINNPNAFSTSPDDYFGGSSTKGATSVAVSESYFIVGAPNEDDASSTSNGKAYIYSTTTGSLLYTLNDPNVNTTAGGDQFGYSVGISETHAIVGAYFEDDTGNANSGKAYIYSTTTGSLLYTLNNPNPFSTSASDNFGNSVAISGSYAIVSATGEGDAGGTQSGKAYIYSTSSGSLLRTLNNPNPFGTSASDNFGKSVAISNSYCIVGASAEDDAGGTTSGKAYIFSNSTGSLLYTLSNPNPTGTSANDTFGDSVGISESYAIVGAHVEDVTASGSGSAYIYSTSTGSLLYTLADPNPVSSTLNDNFGYAVGITDSYAIVSATGEQATGGYIASGNAYIFSTSTGSLVTTLYNPSGYGTFYADKFGEGVAISNSYAVVSAPQEDDAGGNNSGKVYLYNRIVADQIVANATGIQVGVASTSLLSTIVIPTTRTELGNVRAGDIGVLFDTSTTVTSVVPSGWTLIDGVTTTGIRTNISYKILTSGDVGATITGMAGSARKVLYVVRKVDTIFPTVTLSTPGSQATTAAPTNQTITASSAYNVYFAAGASTGTIAGITISQTGVTDGPSYVQSVSTSGIYVGWTVGNTGVNAQTQANATVSMPDGGTNTLQSFRMTVT